jgi:phosphatidylglycerophosphatase GEP4
VILFHQKPAGGIEVLEAINATHRPHTVCMIGDRLMTDIAFGNLNGMQTIWTRQPIDETRDNRVAARVFNI